MLTLLYGGTFDPVHNGHLAVARAAAATLLAEVRMLPARIPPHRPAPIASDAQRARMLTLALADERMIVVDARELERPGPSYTIQTLLSVRDELGEQAPIGLLLGSDAFLGLPTWRLWREFLALAHLVVAIRPGVDLAALPPELAAACAGHWSGQADDLRSLPAGRVYLLDVGARPESSTTLRALLAGGGDWTGMVPAAVADYIRREHLYQA